MNYTKLDLPPQIDKHRTFDILDSSKIQSFQGCPRAFFYRYVLGFEQDKPNEHLVFGSAWHEGLEFIILNRDMDEDLLVMSAFDAFMSVYEEAYPLRETDEARAPKTPQNALKGYTEYVRMWDDRKDFTPLYTEILAVVPVSENRHVYGRMDAVMRKNNTGEIWSHEHKTTKYNSKPWREKWNYIIQPIVYSHVLYCTFPGEDIGGVVINGAIFTKSRGVDFLRIPVAKRPVDMQEGLFEVNHWIDQIDWNFKELERSSVEDEVMTCFPRNGASCSHFGCQFPGICPAWKNPLQHCHQPPPGYEQRYWNPAEGKEEVRTVIEPDEKGELKVEVRP